jgi:hypothetical protein
MGRLRCLRATMGNCGARSRVVTDTTIYDGETPAADKRQGWVHPKSGKAQGNSAAWAKTCTKQARKCDLQTRLPKNVTWIGVNPESEIGTQDWVTDSGSYKPIQIEPTRQPNRILRHMPSLRRVVVPIPVVKQAGFRIQLLPLHRIGSSMLLGLYSRCVWPHGSNSICQTSSKLSCAIKASGVPRWLQWTW